MQARLRAHPYASINELAKFLTKVKVRDLKGTAKVWGGGDRGTAFVDTAGTRVRRVRDPTGQGSRDLAPRLY